MNELKSSTLLIRGFRKWLAATAIFVVTSATSAVADESRSSAFAAANNAAMTKMMAGMDVRPSGDIDRDFVAAMIPHHQGAIDMAVAELRYGSNEKLRRIAQEIVVAQQQEITAMHLALDQPLPPSAPAPTQVSRTASQSVIPARANP